MSIIVRAERLTELINIINNLGTVGGAPLVPGDMFEVEKCLFWSEQGGRGPQTTLTCQPVHGGFLDPIPK